MNQEVKDKIQNAEMILVGIGEEFSMPTPDWSEKGALAPFFLSRFYRDAPQDHIIIRAYNRVRELIGARPYFVVTMNTDDLIFRSDFEDDLIAAPCGSMGKMQCDKHIIDAASICDTVLDTGDILQAVCPECGAPLRFHTVMEDGYLESGYQKQWEKYTKWLTCTLNRKLVILELGVGFRFPQVARWPFEKTAFYNQKSVLVRVNSKFPQLPAELSQRGMSFRESPIDFF